MADVYKAYHPGLDRYVAIKVKQLLDLTEVAHLFTALTDAVDYAHSQGVIHRDLKPDNVMITTGGQVVLTDFGIAQMINVSSDTAADVTGTPLYMSPEQVQGQPADRRSDINLICRPRSSR